MLQNAATAKVLQLLTVLQDSVHWSLSYHYCPMRALVNCLFADALECVGFSGSNVPRHLISNSLVAVICFVHVNKMLSFLVSSLFFPSFTLPTLHHQCYSVLSRDLSVPKFNKMEQQPSPHKKMSSSIFHFIWLLCVPTCFSQSPMTTIFGLFYFFSFSSFLTTFHAHLSVNLLLAIHYFGRTFIAEPLLKWTDPSITGIVINLRNLSENKPVLGSRKNANWCLCFAV